ncbi:DEAD/DEAH box helicase, partial [Escherichia coli]
LYVAPERFSRPGFLDRLAEMRIVRFVVDEAHCISSWGHDFRPEYRQLGRALAACGRPPVAGFTATATPQVRADIVKSIG